jgi:hypothetical protein
MKRLYTIIMIMASLLIPAVCYGEPQVMVVNDNHYFDEKGFFHLVGEVRNESDGFISVEVSAQIFDSNNNRISTEQATIPFSLSPKKLAPFEMITLHPALRDSFSSYRFDLKAEEVDEKPYNLVINSQQNFTDHRNFYRVTGEVSNISAEQTTLVRVVGAFYDERGKVIAVGQEIAETMAPNSTHTFEILVEGDLAASIKNYNLLAESEEYTSVPEFETAIIVLFSSLISVSFARKFIV